MPWVRLIRSHTIGVDKKLPIGRVFKVDQDYAKKLIGDGDAVIYIGSLPPQKMKTDFFKPKK